MMDLQSQLIPEMKFYGCINISSFTKILDLYHSYQHYCYNKKYKPSSNVLQRDIISVSVFTSTSMYTTLKRKAQDTVDMSVGIAGAAVQAVNWQRQKLTAIFTIIPFIFRRGDLSSLKFSHQ